MLVQVSRRTNWTLPPGGQGWIPGLQSILRARHNGQEDIRGPNHRASPETMPKATLESMLGAHPQL